eukprot:15536982-Heterocapsa_arctica.AAC.1
MRRLGLDLGVPEVRRRVHGKQKGGEGSGAFPSQQGQVGAVVPARDAPSAAGSGPATPRGSEGHCPLPPGPCGPW